ncbi:hypothetical protein IDAT_11015 [Pseudidiomarina atlantica]|jgi:hypothetical protein|uniref:Uncharacterized protein n=1 Tax=Pseudidiomarina atlantica TaxID=1517416 RepID=A0A094IK66_9GAMM|nr:hypothetical protein [Pseudidiomarina atlantica]KFZ28110.1 hypothetical protein IDAT_11015 [Pseudidiomarina atlantica]
MEWRALFGLPTKEQEIIAEGEAAIQNELSMLRLGSLCMQQDDEWLTEFLQVLGKSVTGELTIGMACVLIEDGKVTDVETY